jgi:proline iminopeptidase
LSEGERGAYVQVKGFKLFYRVFGEGSNVLLCLHGGPGSTHNYLVPLGKLGDDKIKVVMYDQLGCGNSEKPKDISIFTADYYVEEVEGVRQALGLGKINLLGQSWGAQLALLYALKYQQNLKKLISVGGYASSQAVVEGCKRLKTLLPKDVQETFAKYEPLWAFWHPEYKKAVDVFDHNFICRLPQWPDELVHSANYTSAPVFSTMWGPNNFTAFGNTKDLDFTARLPEIRVPTLVTCGRYDGASPEASETLNKGISGSRLVVFENGSHMPMWEDQAEFLKLVKEFIS